MTTVIGTWRLDVTGHVMRLGQVHPRPAPDGFLAGVPHRAVVLFTRSRDWTGSDCCVSCRAFLVDLYGGQFGALNREVYRVADGRWERIIVENSEDKLSIGASERSTQSTGRCSGT